MKKFITLLLAVLMVASLAACGSKEPAPAADGSAEAAAEPADASVQLKILDTEYVTEDYAIAVAKENTDLRGRRRSAHHGHQRRLPSLRVL